MVNDNTDFFAAACIAAATPLMVEADKVKATPVYAVAGSDDQIMDAAKIKAFVDGIVASGGEAQYDLLEGKDHFGTCDTAFSRERLAWMFAHRKGTATALTQPSAANEEVTICSLSGIKAAPRDGIYIVRTKDGSVKKVSVR